MSEETSPRYPPSYLETDAFIRRLDPDHVELVRDVDDIKGRLLRVEQSNVRQERYLVGGWNEDGSQYIPGVRERVEDMSRKFSWMASGLWAVVLLTIGSIIAKFVH